MSTRPKIVVLGGGFAGLEAAFLVRMRMHDAVDITIVSDSTDFTFKPNTIYIPFGAEPEHFLIGLDKPLRRRNIGFVGGRVLDVDPDTRRVRIDDGTVLPYDFLVVATGAAMRPDEIPGLGEHAAAIFTIDGMLELGERFRAVRDAARRGEHREVLFLVPPNNKCSGPLYEIVFMLETWLRRQKARDNVNITYSTYENSFIQAFGPRLHDVVSGEFLTRGIGGHTGEVVEKVGDGEVLYAGGAVRRYDELVSFPPYVSAVRYDAFASDDRGFVTTQLGTRQAIGYPDVYVPGDAGDFPVKQAFLAFLQADAVAKHIDAHVRGRTFDEPFDPVSMCVMEMFDTATFAQVPLRLTGDPARPVDVRPDADGDYKVGVSPLWRLGKKVLGLYVPMRFRAGEPFHAGTAWTVMDVALKGMSGVLAD